jgi:two-component system sensor histidine kinase UhpB
MQNEIRILILEHDEDDIALIEYELKKGGISYKAKIVETREDYGKALDEFNPDIILSDYSLPSFDGIHAFAMRQEKAPEIPFIFVSGAIGEENSVELIKSGVTDYVLKDKLYSLTLKLNRALKEAEEKKAKLATEMKLIKGERLLAEAQAIARIGNWEINLINDVHTWSLEMYNIYGIETSTVPSAELFVSRLHPEDSGRIAQGMEMSFVTRQDAAFNFRFIHTNGEVRHGRSQWKFELDDSGRALRQYGIMQDITEREMAEQEILSKNEELRLLSSHLQNIREDERKHIAREIHDELGQQLTALKMDIGWVMHKLTAIEKPVEAKLDYILKLSDEIINTVRRISSELRPAIIDDLGLLAALEWKCHDFEEKTDIPCRFVSSVRERKFDSDFGINVYRILQETLTNVSRHAEAKSVSVYLDENEQELTMEVRDDGKGIPEEKLNKGKTLGLVGMRERAKLLGGNLEISRITDNGQGTCTKLTLPYNYEHINSR